MSQTNKNVHKKDEGNHDACENCVRQKKENQAFIKIYERLQDVEKKTFRVKDAIQDHRRKNETNQSFFDRFDQKIINIPKMKDRNSPKLMEKIGFQLASSIIESQVKSKVVEQNLKLKQIIAELQSQKRQNEKDIINQQSQYNENSLFLSERKRQNSSNDSIQKQSVMTMSMQRDGYQKINPEKAYYFQQNQSCQQDKSTKSSSFNFSKLSINRKSVDLNNYNDMSLWLYQNQKHSKLEQQLYLARKVINRSYVKKRTASLLPNIKRKK